MASCGRPEGEKYDVTTKILPSSVHPSSFTAADLYDARAPRFPPIVVERLIRSVDGLREERTFPVG